MLKRLAIVGLSGALAAVCLLAGQTAPLSPPKQGITKTSSGQNGRNQAQTRNGQQSSVNTVLPTQQPAAPTCDEGCQQGRQNLVIQRKLEWFTGVLAIVGVLQMVLIGWQAVLLRQTRGDVKRQADWMETQAGHMSKQADLMDQQLAEMRTGSEIAKVNADAAKVTAKASALSAVAAEESAKVAQRSINITILKERALLRVEIDPLKVVLPGENTWLSTVNMKVFNVGVQRAFPTRSHATLIISDTSKRTKAKYPMSFLTQSVISSSDEPVEQQASTGANKDTVFLLNTEQRFAHLYGEIVYSDIFETGYVLRFRCVWRTNGWVFAASTVLSGSDDPEGAKELYGEWEKAGDEDNEINAEDDGAN